jgi:hypothetical protein
VQALIVVTEAQAWALDHWRKGDNMGNFALPAANFLREMNNMLYRERESAKRHDEAMGSIGLRTATFKYQMEQDRQARQERQAARKLNQENIEFQQKLQVENAQRQQALFEDQRAMNQIKVEQAKQLVTPTDFRAYDVIPKGHIAWNNPEFVADLEEKTGGKFNRASGMFMANGENKKIRPLDIKRFLPIMVGNADILKGDSIQDNLLRAHDLRGQIQEIDAEITKLSGGSGGDPRRAVLITKKKRERTQVMEAVKRATSRLQPESMLETYGNNRKRFARLAQYATGLGLTGEAAKFQTQSNQNMKMELELLGNMTAQKTGNNADRLLPWVKHMDARYGKMDSTGNIIITPGLQSEHAWATNRFRQLVVNAGGANISPDAKMLAENRAYNEGKARKQQAINTISVVLNFRKKQIRQLDDTQIKEIVTQLQKFDNQFPDLKPAQFRAIMSDRDTREGTAKDIYSNFAANYFSVSEIEDVIGK